MSATFEDAATRRENARLQCGALSMNDNSGYTIRHATNAGEVEELRDFWTKLNRHPDADLDFYFYFVGSQQNVIGPFIVVAEKNQKCAAILIGRLEYATVPIKLGYFTLFNLKVRQIAFVQEGLLGDSSPQIARLMVSDAVKCLFNGVADRASFSNLPLDNELHQSAKTAPSAWTRNQARDFVARWRTKIPNTFDEFLARRSRKHRYWLRRIQRVFEEKHPGQITYKFFHSAADVTSFCLAAEEIAQQTYQRGLGVGFVDTDSIRRRLKLSGEKGWFRAYVVFVAGQPVAFWCGRFYNKTMYLDWTGYKPEYGKYELGTILFLKMVEDLCSAGADEIDYGMGAASYKKRFGDYDLTEEHVSIYAPTVKGVVIRLLKDLDTVINRFAKSIVSKWGLDNKIKRYWRKSLARTDEKESAHDPDSEPQVTQRG